MEVLAIVSYILNLYRRNRVSLVEFIGVETGSFKDSHYNLYTVFLTTIHSAVCPYNKYNKETDGIQVNTRAGF